MILKNLLRRKTRTLLNLLGIAVGVPAAKRELTSAQKALDDLIQDAPVRAAQTALGWANAGVLFKKRSGCVTYSPL